MRRHREVLGFAWPPAEARRGLLVRLRLREPAWGGQTWHAARNSASRSATSGSGLRPTAAIRSSRSSADGSNASCDSRTSFCALAMAMSMAMSLALAMAMVLAMSMAMALAMVLAMSLALAMALAMVLAMSLAMSLALAMAMVLAMSLSLALAMAL